MKKSLKKLVGTLISFIKSKSRKHAHTSADLFSPYEGGPPPPGMTFCPFCAVKLMLPNKICPHHLSEEDEQWGIGNAIRCDFVHRKEKEVPPRLPPNIRNEGWETFAADLREDVEQRFDLLPKS